MSHSPLTQATVLEALRQIQLRQFVRGRHTALLDRLHGLGLVAWVKQPSRASEHLLPDHERAGRVPEEIAELTAAGRVLFERLAALRQAPDWAAVAGQPWG
ncbi:MAG: hypothetical protein LBV34_13275 [Nocardiopsaceae bacterium]|jgi:hypothetical protein|nr:hypothetical protein [Nocardiopsaceae bacterium]